MAKQPTSVSLTQEQRQAIERAREQLAIHGEKPTRNEVIRQAINRGLPVVVEAAGRKDR